MKEKSGWKPRARRVVDQFSGSLKGIAFLLVSFFFFSSVFACRVTTPNMVSSISPCPSFSFLFFRSPSTSPVISFLIIFFCCIPFCCYLLVGLEVASSKKDRGGLKETDIVRKSYLAKLRHDLTFVCFFSIFVFYFKLSNSESHKPHPCT
ncbi:MAG: hypothetical protein J3R72DRAFT_227738 [Linnemannia gamsii]|nr:MAG: hypothetical protein J3R72DRAFT_227738 [Linnemannia gamsii]